MNPSEFLRESATDSSQNTGSGVLPSNTSPAPTNKIFGTRSPKIAIVMPDDFALWQPRRFLLRYLVDQGFEVHAISEPGEYVDRIQNLGVKHIAIKANRFLNPLADIRTVFSLYWLFRREKYDIVSAFTTKINVLAAVAAWLARIPRIVTAIEGAGYAFEDTKGFKRRLLRKVVASMYRLSCRASHAIRFFQDDDLLLFEDEGILKSREKTFVIKGIGIDLEEYSSAKLDGHRIEEVRRQFTLNNRVKLVIMVSRALWSKGIQEFIDASTQLSNGKTDVKFILVGAAQNGLGEVPREYLDSQCSNAFEWVGFWPDLREIYAVADVVVLSSYYREGTPGALVEAMAMGKPLVVADNVGSRETVDEGLNGFIVPPRDSAALANAICDLISNDNLIYSFGQHSLHKARMEHDPSTIYRRFLVELYHLRFDEKENRWRADEQPH